MMYLVLNVFELHNGHADEPVVPEGAVVLDGDVQLVEGQSVFVANDTEIERNDNESGFFYNSGHIYSSVDGVTSFIVFPHWKH